MLTRIRLQGFKSFEDAEVRFGPFTCIAGPKGVGKSNLFDAIQFLRDLTEFPIIADIPHPSYNQLMVNY
jgi:AAA15 family ATPase/GTPase